MNISIHSALLLKKIDFCLQILAVPLMISVVISLNGDKVINPYFFFSECTIQIFSYLFWNVFEPDVMVTSQRTKLSKCFTIVIVTGVIGFIPGVVIFYLMLLLPVGAVLGTMYLLNTYKEIEILKGAVRPLSAIR